MKYILISMLICFCSCVHTAQKNNIQSLKKINIPPLNRDTSKYAILIFNEKEDGYLFDKHVKPYTLTQQEINNIENLIIKKVAAYNKSIVNNKYAEIIKQPEKYHKQIIAVINKKGEKEVWVNCCCDIIMMPNWKEKWITVNDGGSCYFGLKINLTKDTVLQFGVNGLA